MNPSNPGRLLIALSIIPLTASIFLWIIAGYMDDPDTINTTIILAGSSTIITILAGFFGLVLYVREEGTNKGIVWMCYIVMAGSIFGIMLLITNVQDNGSDAYITSMVFVFNILVLLLVASVILLIIMRDKVGKDKYMGV